MMDAHDHEKTRQQAIEKMLGRTLRRGLQPGGDTCPAPDILAAYHEESLSLEEKENLESHFAVCLRCQETLSALAVSEPIPEMVEQVAMAAAPAMAQAVAVGASTKSPAKSRWFAHHWGWLVPAVSFAAIAGIALWIQHKPTQKPIEVAHLNTKTSVPATTAAPSSGEVLTADAKAPQSAPAAASISRARTSSPNDEESKKQKESRIASAIKALPAGAVNKLGAAREADALSAEMDRNKIVTPPKSAPATGAALARNGAGVGGGIVGGVASSPAPQPPAPAPQSPTVMTGRDVAADVINARADKSLQKAPQQQNAPLNLQPNNAQGAAGSPGAATEQVQVSGATQQVVIPKPQSQQSKDDKGKQESGLRMLDAPAGTAGSAGGLRAANVEEFGVQAGVRFAPRMIPTPDANVVWRIGPGGHIARSTDGGKTWQDQTSGVTEQLISGSAPTTKICWVGGFGGTVLRTTDGEHWEKVTSPGLSPWIRITATDEAHAVVATNGNKSLATTDGGRTWQPQ